MILFDLVNLRDDLYCNILALVVIVVLTPDTEGILWVGGHSLFVGYLATRVMTRLPFAKLLCHISCRHRNRKCIDSVLTRDIRTSDLIKNP